MINRTINAVLSSVLRWRLKSYLRYPASATALILVDVQPAFLKDQQELAVSLTTCLNFARTHEIAVYWTAFGGSQPDRPLAPGMQTLFDHLTANAGYSLPNTLRPTGNDIQLPPRATFSAFAGTALSDRLRADGIEHVVLAGSFADLSIDSTARDASETGFHTTVLKDCCGATSDKAHDATLNITLPRMVHAVLTSHEWFAHVAAETQPQLN